MSAALPPITIDQITPEWIKVRREIILRDGFALRAGERCSIEVKSLTTNEWITLTLPDGALAFATADERDAVLNQLQRPAQ